MFVLFPATASGSLYNHSSSSTYIKDGERFEIGYVDGTFIQGYKSLDTVGIGVLAIKNQIFGEAINQSKPISFIIKFITYWKLF